MFLSLGTQTETEVIQRPGFTDTITDTQGRGFNDQTQVIQTPGGTEVINTDTNTGGGWGRR